MQFKPITRFLVAAGIGTFKPLYARPYSVIAGVYFATDLTNFLSNAQRVIMTDPVKAPDTPCAHNETQKRSRFCSASYFVPGGVELITPWPSKNEDHWDAETYQVKDLQGYQLDFGEMAAGARFDGSADCKVFGDSDASVQICVSSHTGPGAEQNVLNAKFVHCPLDVASSSNCERDTDWHASTGWTTALRPYIRRSTTTFSRLNGTIISTSRALSPPQPALISASDLLSVFSLSFNTTSGSVTGTSSALRFVQYLATVMTFAETSSFTYSAATGYLRNLLVLPLYYFHDNNLAPAVEPSPDAPLKGLPSELYTDASLAKVRYRIVVGRTTTLIYVAGGSLVILACLVVLVAGSLRPWAGKIPETTAFPVLDFVRSCEVAGPEVKLADMLKGSKDVGGRQGRRKLDCNIVLS